MRHQQRRVRVLRPVGIVTPARRLLVTILAVACVLATAATPIGATAPARSGPVVVAVIDTGLGPGGALARAVDWDRSRSVVAGEGLADRDGHGTAMANVVHAAAPDARIVVVKAIGAGGGTSDAELAEAVRHAATVGAAVISLSVAGAEPLPRTRAAIAQAGEAGTLVVVAAGNDGVDLDDHAGYPGGYRLDNLVTVAATGGEGDLLASSNHGGPVSARALGVAVPTCALDGTATRTGGTSAAAALVAGTAARLLAERGGSLAQLRDALATTTPPITTPACG